jgi:hypothetical protein
MSTKHQSTVRLELEALEMRTVPSTVLDVAKAIANSVEAETREVVAEYATFLGRAPSQAEASGWVQQIRNGMSYETLDANFLAAVEFVNQHGGGGAPWVVSIYQSVLGRTPSQGEVNGWVASLNSGATQVAVANAITNSDERLAIIVRYDYGTFLGRMPAASELGGWTAQLKSGTSEQDVAAGFVASTEFVNGRSFGNLHQWVADAYASILGRFATENEIQGWLAVLRGP